MSGDELIYPHALFLGNLPKLYTKEKLSEYLSGCRLPAEGVSPDVVFLSGSEGGSPARAAELAYFGNSGDQNILGFSSYAYLQFKSEDALKEFEMMNLPLDIQGNRILTFQVTTQDIPLNRRKIYVAIKSFPQNGKVIKEYVEKFGPLIGMDRIKGYGDQIVFFVTFLRQRSAEKFLCLRPHFFHGHRADVQRYNLSDDIKTYNSGKRNMIVVSGLHENTTEDEIWNYFAAEDASVKDIKLFREDLNISCKTRNYCFVEFYDEFIPRKLTHPKKRENHYINHELIRIKIAGFNKKDIFSELHDIGKLRGVRYRGIPSDWKALPYKRIRGDSIMLPRIYNN